MKVLVLGLNDIKAGATMLELIAVAVESDIEFYWEMIAEYVTKHVLGGEEPGITYVKV